MQLIAFAIVLQVLLAAAPVYAQSYPSKSIRYIVGFTPGTAADIVARLVSNKVSERWSRRGIVDNRVRAAGAITASLGRPLSIRDLSKSCPDERDAFIKASPISEHLKFIESVS